MLRKLFVDSLVTERYSWVSGILRRSAIDLLRKTSWQRLAPRRFGEYTLVSDWKPLNRRKSNCEARSPNAYAGSRDSLLDAVPFAQRADVDVC